MNVYEVKTSIATEPGRIHIGGNPPTYYILAEGVSEVMELIPPSKSPLRVDSVAVKIENVIVRKPK